MHRTRYEYPCGNEWTSYTPLGVHFPVPPIFATGDSKATRVSAGANSPSSHRATEKRSGDRGGIQLRGTVRELDPTGDHPDVWGGAGAVR
ncbi:MAG: hypothetical protein KGJ23_12370 [Euryarchaeota archaeon]|nr:hypothetical protein [Euryarchaeota archaeon]MDE1837392.1 hypothetical protein [Euryarchaeota archaeon]MDE1881939.1 hypothetical protein [Euryarchaeota archaeon]MDE2045508.1 hypothetical protein [Thermoplasmata archaeon]